MAPQECKCNSTSSNCDNCTCGCDGNCSNKKKDFQATTKIEGDKGKTQTLAVEGGKNDAVDKDDLKDAMRTDLEHKGTH